MDTDEILLHKNRIAIDYSRQSGKAIKKCQI